MGLFDRQTREERFWKWFEANSDRLFDVESDQERKFSELRHNLRRVKKGLVFEFGAIQDGRRPFVISADGLVELFPVVRRLVEVAPEMARWTVTPFRPPGSLNVVIEYGDHKLGPDDICFTAETDGDRIGLTLYVRGLTEETKPALVGACYVLLDNALGEFSASTEISFIDWRALPDPLPQGLRPFREIREPFHGAQH